MAGVFTPLHGLSALFGRGELRKAPRGCEIATQYYKKKTLDLQEISVMI